MPKLYKKPKDITLKLNEYKENVDNKIVNLYLSEKREIDSKIDEVMSDPKYSKEYKQQIKNEYRFKKDYAGMMGIARKDIKRDIQNIFDSMYQYLKDYCNKPVSVEFNNTINAILQSGLYITNREFDLLKESAQSHFELRILQKLGESRTREEIKAVTDEKGTLKNEKVAVADPYPIDVVNLDVLKGAIDNAKVKAELFLNAYAGKNDELIAYTGTDNYLTGSANNYFKQNCENELVIALNKASALMPTRTTPTEEEQKLYDIAMGECLTDYSKARLREKILSDEALAGVFADNE